VSETIEISDAGTRFEELVERAAAGEEIIITVVGEPRARLIALEPKQRPRKPGGWKGQIWIADDFDDPLPTDILAGFMGEENEDTT